MGNMPNNPINQINMQNNMYNQFMQASLMSNCQAEIMRMNYYSNLNHLNSNLYSPVVIPKTEDSIVEDLEAFFSIKNLNRDINLRKNMDEETGNVQIDFILNLNQIRSINLTEDKISKLIDKVGSDKIEKIMIDKKLYIRPKNFEEIKGQLKSIEEIEKELNEKANKKKKQQQQNIPMNIQPMGFYPVQPFIYCAPMMIPIQQNMQNPPPGLAYPIPINVNNNNQNNN